MSTLPPKRISRWAGLAHAARSGGLLGSARSILATLAVAGGATLAGASLLADEAGFSRSERAGGSYRPSAVDRFADSERVLPLFAETPDIEPAQHTTSRPTSIDELEQRSASERWERLKEGLKPAATDAATDQTAKTPATDEASEFELTAPRAAAAPGDAADEPPWVLGSPTAPLESTELASPATAAEPVAIPPSPVAQPVAQPAADGATSVPRVALRQQPNAGAETELEQLKERETPAGRTDAELEGSLLNPDKARLGPRRMTDIIPVYDRDSDNDIRQFAAERAREYNIDFGDQPFEPREFPMMGLNWEAPNLYHYPLYFQDPAFERYGHAHHPLIQPAVSVGRFGVQLLALPYQMTIDPILKKEYTLGWYRPGEVAPKLHYQVPLNASAAAVEAGVVTGLFFLIP